VRTRARVNVLHKARLRPPAARGQDQRDCNKLEAPEPARQRARGRAAPPLQARLPARRVDERVRL